MNFSINKDVLLHTLNDVSKALSNKVQMPGLTGIKFNVSKQAIVLTTSNNEISIQATIEKDFVVIEEGEFIVQGKYLIDLVRRINNKDVDFLTFEGNNVKVLSGKSDFTLNCLQLDSFPNIKFNVQNFNISINALNLKQIIKKTAFATSTSESRVVLTGVSFIIKDNILEVIATDSYRLARKQIFFDYDLSNVNIVIPGRSLDELNKIIDESEENVFISCSSTQILFKYRNLLFQTRLIDGVFPKTESLIPSNYLTKIKFNKEALISTIERVAIFVNNEVSNIIKFTIDSDNVVEFTSISNEVGVGKEEIIPLSCSQVCPFQISFSSKYFLDALRSFDDEEIYVNFTGEIKPFTITSEKDRNLIQLILPVRA